MKAVGLDEPLFIRKGKGAYVTTAGGERYVDWVMSFGPLIFGHADRETVEAVQQTADEGTTFGAHDRAGGGARGRDRRRLPLDRAGAARQLGDRGGDERDPARPRSDEARPDPQVRGCYHGHADALLAEAGSGPATLGVPATAGVPSGATADTIVAPYNDIEEAALAVARYGEGLAAVIVEPVAGNMGVVPPAPGFLEALRELCDASGALLVFDEVITGFRIARGGAQERLGVSADLTVLGKIVGGGHADRRLRRLRGDHAPPRSGRRGLPGRHALGKPAGNGRRHPVLRRLRDPAVYEELEGRAARLEEGLKDMALSNESAPC